MITRPVPVIAMSLTTSQVALSHQRCTSSHFRGTCRLGGLGGWRRDRYVRGLCWRGRGDRRLGRVGDGVHAEGGRGGEDEGEPLRAAGAVLPLQVHHDLADEGGEELRVLRCD